MKDIHCTGICFTIISAVLYGFNPLFSISYYGVGGNTWSLVCIRMFIGALFLFALYKISSEESLRIDSMCFRKLILCSIGYGLTPLLLFTSYNYIASGLATTIHFIYPVFVLVGCVLFKHQKLTKIKIICCVLCMQGIVLFYSPEGNIDLKGISIALISGIAFAFYIIYLSSSGLQEINPYKLGGWLCMICAIFISIIAFASGNLVWPCSWRGYIVAVVFAVVNAGASVFFQLGEKFIGPQNVSLLSTFEPLTSVIVGNIIYRESFGTASALGIICILSAVILLALKGEKNAV